MEHTARPLISINRFLKSDTKTMFSGRFVRWLIQLSDSAPWDIADYPPIAKDPGNTSMHARAHTPSDSESDRPGARNAVLDALALDARQVRYDIWELQNTRWMIRQVQSMRFMATGIIKGPVFRRLAEAQGINMVFEGPGHP